MALCSSRRHLLLHVVFLSIFIASKPGLQGERIMRSSETAEATGEESSDSTHVGETRADALSGICERTRSKFISEATEDSKSALVNRIYSSWVERSNNHPDGFEWYFSRKPQTTPSNAVCVGMNETCCEPGAEKEMLVVARKQYGLVYQRTIEDHFIACPTAGREFYHGMRSTLRESRRRLEIRINETVKLLPKDAFNRLYNYLTDFSISPDICPIKSLINDQVKNITRLVVDTFVQSSVDFENVSQNVEQMECIKNITEALMEDHVTNIMAAFGRQLYDLKLFIQGFQLAEKVIKTVKRHTFSPSCVSALTRMKHCKICAGIIIFHACNNLCLNTMSGCLADLAELEQDFGKMLSELKALAVHLETELSPEVFNDNLLEGFVNVVQDLKNTEYSWWTKTATQCGGSQSIVFERERRRTLFYQPLSAGFEEEETRVLTLNQGEEDAFSSAFQVELGCLDELQSLLLSLPTDMCYSNHIPTDSVNCWTGTRLERNYGVKLAGRLKADQVNNEAFSHLPMDTDILYADLIHELRAMGKKINATLVYRQECFDSDDEDCTRNHFASCEGHPDFDDNFSSGSASGSGCEPGSEFGSGSGAECESGSRLPPGVEDMEVSTVFPERVDEEVIPDFNRPNAGGLYRDQINGRITTPDETETESTRNSDVSMGTMTIIATEDDDDININDLDEDDNTRTDFDITKDTTSSKDGTDVDIDNTPVKEAATDVESQSTDKLFSGSQSLHRLTLITPLCSLLFTVAHFVF